MRHLSRQLKSARRAGGVLGLVVEGDGERVVCERCIVADTPLMRLKGLLGKRELAAGEGLLIYPSSAVHTWFMRFPIDAVFLDRELRVLDLATELKPWRAAAGRQAKAVLELAAGECRRQGIETGSTLKIRHA